MSALLFAGFFLLSGVVVCVITAFVVGPKSKLGGGSDSPMSRSPDSF